MPNVSEYLEEEAGIGPAPRFRVTRFQDEVARQLPFLPGGEEGSRTPKAPCGTYSGSS